MKFAEQRRHVNGHLGIAAPQAASGGPQSAARDRRCRPEPPRTLVTSPITGVKDDIKTSTLSVSTTNATPAGTYRFHVQATRTTGCQGGGAAHLAQRITLVVNSANTAPTANADSYNATEDTPLNVAAPGVLGNDTDPRTTPSRRRSCPGLATPAALP